MVFSDEEGLALLRKFDRAGIPAVAVMLSGRPLWVNREINAADAFVAAWLPGSEGAGVADVLYGKRPATGRLGFSWPAQCDGKPVNGPDGALFNVGYGLSLAAPASVVKYSERCDYLVAAPASDWFAQGKLAPGVTFTGDGQPLANVRGTAGGISARGIDYKRQEDAREISFAPGATLAIGNSHRGTGAYRIGYFLGDAPKGKVTLAVGKTSLDITRNLALSAGKGWREMIVTEACAPGLGDGIALTSAAPLTLRIASIARVEMPAGADCSF